MTSSDEIRNVPASVRRRLLNRARAEETDFNHFLQRYANERFLYRLGLCGEVDRFTLKGASLFLIWAGKEFRPTRDIDLLGEGPADHASLRRAMEMVCAVPCPEDGVVFDPASIRIGDIRHDQEYGGVRVRLRGSLGKTRLTVQVDVGFGDVVTPGREEREYPTLLDHPAPRLWAYPRETLVAEKFEAMVRLGPVNSRVKDLWDIAWLARHFDFDGETLRSAIEKTFRRPGTAFANDRPEALWPEHYRDPTRDARWREFSRQVEAGGQAPADLAEVGAEVVRFLGPVCDTLIGAEPFTREWPAGGAWQPTTHGE